MNRPLAINARQIRAICEGAKKAGYAPVLEINNVVIRLIPEEHVVIPKEKTKAEEAEEDFKL